MAQKKKNSGNSQKSLQKPVTKSVKKVSSARLEDVRFLAGDDPLGRDTWRTFRIMSEFIKGLEKLTEVDRGVSMFGSARVKPGSPYYELARKTAYEIGKAGFEVLTGGGPGIMEACNRGAKEADAVSVGLAIKLPFESSVNPWCDISETFNFFFVRKVMLVKFAHAFIIFPGGYGTLDETFEALTLIQTGKVENFPVILMGTEFWKPLLEWLKEVPMREGMIKPKDFDDLHLIDDPKEACRIVKAAWGRFTKQQEADLRQKAREFFERTRLPE
jgi:uncharacterized protein (TIGR00730 family)